MSAGNIMLLPALTRNAKGWPVSCLERGGYFVELEERYDQYTMRRLVDLFKDSDQQSHFTKKQMDVKDGETSGSRYNDFYFPFPNPGRFQE